MKIIIKTINSLFENIKKLYKNIVNQLLNVVNYIKNLLLQILNKIKTFINNVKLVIWIIIRSIKTIIKNILSIIKHILSIFPLSKFVLQLWNLLVLKKRWDSRFYIAWIPLLYSNPWSSELNLLEYKIECTISRKHSAKEGYKRLWETILQNKKSFNLSPKEMKMHKEVITEYERFLLTYNKEKRLLKELNGKKVQINLYASSINEKITNYFTNK